MSQAAVMKLAPGAVLVAALGLGVASFAQEPSPLFELSRRPTSTMSNPYRLIESWPTLRPGMEWGAAIGLIPDGTGGTWMMFRSEPPINYINAEGQITKSFGDGMIVQAHGFCMDGDGNLWAGDSGPFGDDPSTAGRGFQLHKFSQDGELLMSLGQAGVSAAGEDTFIGPTACAVAPNGSRGPRPPSRTATGWSRSPPTASSCGRWGDWDWAPASSWGRTRWRSTRRGGCSSPTGRTTASRSSTRT